MQYVEDIPAIRSKYALRKDWKLSNSLKSYGKEATEIAYKKKRSTIFLWNRNSKSRRETVSTGSRGQSTSKTSGTE